MKIVKLMGGLGNQMFQYAFGQVLGKNTYYDLSWFNKVRNSQNATIREYELDFFQCTPNIISEKEIKKQKTNLLFKILGIKNNIPDIHEEKYNIYEPELLKHKEGIFEGYFQAAQYYMDIRPQLLKDFVPRQKPNKINGELLKKIQSVNSVSIHVRRGDYVQLQTLHGLCDLDYYKKAVHLIKEKVKNPHFFLFSDDISWVTENLKIDAPFTIVDNNKGREAAWDMWLMKNCQHNIIANSSFSWWGAWLNENLNKIVVAPKQWFVKRKTDIVPDDWERI